MTSCTPGPWFAASVQESYFDDVSICRVDGLAIAVAVNNGDIGTDEAHANGKLIAAAPDMLLMLKTIASHWQTDYCPQGWDEIKVNTHRVIQKATGTGWGER